MSVSAVRNKLFCFGDCVFEILRLIHSQYGRQFFVSKLFVQTYAGNFSDKNFRFLGYFYTGKLRYFICGLTGYFGVERTVDYYSASHLIRFFVIQQIAAPVLELFLNLVVNFIQNYDRLFGRTNYTVIERLGMYNRVDCNFYVCGIVDNRRSVSGTNAERRLARRTT